MGVERALAVLYPQLCMLRREGSRIRAVQPQFQAIVHWLVPMSDMIIWMSWFKGRCSVSAGNLQQGIMARDSFRELCHWSFNMQAFWKSRHLRHFAIGSILQALYSQIMIIIIKSSCTKATITKSSELFVLPPWQMPTVLSAPKNVWYSLCMHPTTIQEK